MIGEDTEFPQPIQDQNWRIEVAGFDRLREREFESWLSVANGRTGTRGALEEGGEESAPAVYIAGMYDRSDEAASGPKLVRGPEWIHLEPRVAGGSVRLDQGDTIEHKRILDLRSAILFRSWRQRLPSGIEFYFRSARFASLADRRIVALEAEASADGEEVELLAGIPTSWPTAAIREHEEQGGRVRIAVQEIAAREGAVSFSFVTTRSGERIERFGSVTRLTRPAETTAAAGASLAGSDFEGLRARHLAAWQQRWGESDVVVEGDDRSQLALRFALYHLISSVDPESDLASIGARGLTGDGYHGHVFWDTDVFVLPFYIYTYPEAARALLGYRFRTLPAARRKAERLGYRGALFAWESADTGDEITPAYVTAADGSRMRVLTGAQEQHISADVAWASWRYWQATQDEAFLIERGARLILETARFWASRARKGRDGRHHIGKVIGPDEYHEGVVDNAFTNVMARWNLHRGLEVVELLTNLAPGESRKLFSEFGLGARELRRWAEVADGLLDGFDPQSLLYEQFAGFFRLSDVRATELGERPFAGELMLSGTRLRRSRLVKQADVLMLAHMLPELVAPDVAAANYRYYEPRTSHGSSLSPAIHAAVAARVGALAEALDYFDLAGGVDLDDRMGNATQGVHLAAAGGLWQAAVFGFVGIRPEDAGLRIDPHLPRRWQRLRVPVRWRGSRVEILAAHHEVRVRIEGAATIALGKTAPRSLGTGSYRGGREGDGWTALVAESDPC